MLDVITVPVSRLIFRHREIGIHRGRRWGFRDVFGFKTLRDLPFIELARLVKAAYEGQVEPSHEGWPAQREALRWLVEKNCAGIYALDAPAIEVRHVLIPRVLEPARALDPDTTTDSCVQQDEDSVDDQDSAHVAASQIEVELVPDRYYIFDGHHRALALFILGEEEISVRINAEPWPARRSRSSGADRKRP